jgi:hypothetical protein
MPAAFLGHGSPMNSLENNRYTDAWRAFGASVPRPRGIVVMARIAFAALFVLRALSRGTFVALACRRPRRATAKTPGSRSHILPAPYETAFPEMQCLHNCRNIRAELGEE